MWRPGSLHFVLPPHYPWYAQHQPVKQGSRKEKRTTIGEEIRKQNTWKREDVNTTEIIKLLVWLKSLKKSTSKISQWPVINEIAGYVFHNLYPNTNQTHYPKNLSMMYNIRYLRVFKRFTFFNATMVHKHQIYLISFTTSTNLGQFEPRSGAGG